MAHSTGAKKEINLDGPAASGNERILIVDDEIDIALIASDMLQGFGYQVMIKNDSHEALSHFVEQPDQYDLVITDMTMPKMNGASLSRELRKIKPGVKIVVCSGYSELEEEQRVRAMEPQGYLKKPFSIKDLTFVVRQALDNPAAA